METAETAGPVDPVGSSLDTSSRHMLLVSDAVRQGRAGAAAWVERELVRGAKVYYKGWLDEGLRPDQHWIAGPEGARGARAAFASGQLEFMDFPTAVTRAENNHAGLLRLLTGEVERALDERWPAVAMTQESFKRPLVDGAEVAEYVRQEAAFDKVAERGPVRVLCQLTVPVENDTAVWEGVALHHGDVVDDTWSAAIGGGRWRPRGDLDAHVARRFGAAVHGALRAAAGGGLDPDHGPDLHLDLGEVEFIDVACAEILMLAARSAPAGQHVVVHRASRFQWHLFDAVGRAPALVEGEGWR